MTSILARGQSVLKSKLEANASETVRVIRGASVLCDAWPATPGQTLTEVTDESQATIIGRRHDWLGDPSEWRLNNEVVKPRRGDLIEWSRGARTLVFECLPADGDDVWAAAGRFQDRMRVHTKLIETRPNP